MAEITIICDLRERVSHVINELHALSSSRLKVNIIEEQLMVGDYQISDDLVIERKTIADLSASIIDGRIFEQLKELSKIPKSALIIEGSINFLDNSKGINKRALAGLITKIGLEHRIPVFFTRNQKESALFIHVMAKKEQIDKGNRTQRARFSKTKMGFSKRQQFIVESLPDIGPKLAKSLLIEFKTIKNIANADIDELQKVDKLGPKRAEKIKYIFERSFCD